MKPILLTDRAEYQFVTDRGFCPLLDYKRFTMDIRLRVEIQRELFGHCVFGLGLSHRQTNGFLGGYGSLSRTDARKRYDLCTIFRQRIVPIFYPVEHIRRWRTTHEISIYFASKCTTVGRMATVRKCEYIRQICGLLS